MRKLSLCFAFVLGIMLLTSLSMAQQRVEDAEEVEDTEEVIDDEIDDTLVPSNGGGGRKSGPWDISPGHTVTPFRMCLSVRSSDNGAQVEQAPCAHNHRDANKEWYFISTDSGHYLIQNLKSGKCLNVKGASKKDGAKVILYTCGVKRHNDQWYADQRYRDSESGQDYYYLVNRRSKRCLNVRGASQDTGADLIQWKCGNSSDNDEFTWWSSSTRPGKK